MSGRLPQGGDRDKNNEPEEDEGDVGHIDDAPEDAFRITDRQPGHPYPPDPEEAAG